MCTCEGGAVQQRMEKESCEGESCDSTVDPVFAPVTPFFEDLRTNQADKCDRQTSPASDFCSFRQDVPKDESHYCGCYEAFEKDHDGYLPRGEAVQERAEGEPEDA
ncbi:MAG TPA: hypothetical protein DIU35_10135 [Candidatus Latescibacteria bacterium]|nr:hypothetical protein [Gemmatimonadota bacterium]HCR17830.1 hypothetical protein [Candidatus Latescibacterota bacterium]